MTYFQLRISHGCEELKNFRHNFIMLFKYLIRTKNIDTYALCEEKIDKFGNETTKHFHFNFLHTDSKETMRTYILRKLEKQDIKLRGNKQYMLQAITEPEDFSRWMRYCFKEKILEYKIEEEMFDADLQTKLAKDERARSIEHNKKVAEKQKEKSTFYDRMEKSLIKKGLKDKIDIFIAMVEFYQAEKKSVPSTTIDGYVVLFMLNQKIITPRQYYYATSKIQHLEF